MEQATQEVKMQIRATDDIARGTYANNVVVHMTREEFTLDFVNIIPPHATLNARVTLSPGHLKRMIQALAGSLERFEREFGSLTPAPQQPATHEFVQ